MNGFDFGSLAFFFIDPLVYFLSEIVFFRVRELYGL